MNSDLSALIDAIFGKQDLDSVSLDEMYELIQEFPSFNAGHFLLSKKLKLENQVASFEKETMRTALYFNNPFWLQSVLGGGSQPVNNHLGNGDPKPKDFTQSVQETIESESVTIVSEFFSEEKDLDYEVSATSEGSGDLIIPPQQSYQEEPIVLPFSDPETLDLKEESPMADAGPVTSFDELMSKYRIDPQETTPETPEELKDVIVTERVEENPGFDETETDSRSFTDLAQQPVKERKDDQVPVVQAQENQDSLELREEVFNEYGIFEEVIVKKTDFDLEAFDRPASQSPIVSEEPVASTQELTEPLVENPVLSLYKEEVLESTSESIVENPLPDTLEKEQSQADYEAFDRPIDSKAHEEIREDGESVNKWLSEQESNLESESSEEGTQIDIQDNSPAEHGKDSGIDHMPGLAARFEEEQKARVPFDPKKAESIVFAPYHMIDYFASQGIKLVMEENPADSFGKQLKSFTDWLKVMKRVPVKAVNEKVDDLEADRIRHFAAHSVDEREILTESMAEVLAKQGMYENAIALYQKLSLIYPPKSAYFASRIEQLKASLP